MPPPPQHGGQGMSTFDKMKMGAIMGTCVGLTMGFIFGGYTIFKHGAGPNGVIRSLGQYMLGSAATFGFFMSIGTAIRTEGPEGSEKMKVYQALLQKARDERRALSVVVAARPALEPRRAEEKRTEA